MLALCIPFDLTPDHIITINILLYYKPVRLRKEKKIYHPSCVVFADRHNILLPIPIYAIHLCNKTQYYYYYYYHTLTEVIFFILFRAGGRNVSRRRQEKSRPLEGHQTRLARSGQVHA